jgi:hypothetical protein
MRKKVRKPEINTSQNILMGRFISEGDLWLNKGIVRQI